MQLCTELLWKLKCERDAFLQTTDVKETCEEAQEDSYLFHLDASG